MYIFNIHPRLISVLFFQSFLLNVCFSDLSGRNEETWEQDLTNAFKIEASKNGLKKVNLKCGADTMHVELETEEDFEGVMYTKGSFYKQAEPCFVRPKDGKARALEMTFAFDKCQTLNDGDVYSNVVVVQHDPELITPGDSAFQVECDFRQSRSLPVQADMKTRDRIAFGSRITLFSPDPSALPETNENKLDTVFNKSCWVTYTPKRDKDTSSKIVGTIEVAPVNEAYKINDEL